MHILVENRFSPKFSLPGWSVSYFLVHVHHTLLHYPHGANTGCDWAGFAPVFATNCAGPWNRFPALRARLSSYQQRDNFMSHGDVPGAGTLMPCHLHYNFLTVLTWVCTTVCLPRLVEPSLHPQVYHWSRQRWLAAKRWALKRYLIKPYLGS